MKYDYSTVKDGKYIVFKFSEAFQVLDYVFKEMSNFGGAIFKEFVEKVISRKSVFERIGANMCYMDIKKDYTSIDLWIEKNNL